MNYKSIQTTIFTNPDFNSIHFDLNILLNNYKENMSSPPVDPRRPEKIRPYKPNSANTSGGEDFICDYMNILGMIFSMCGLMMKLKWCGEYCICE